MKKQIKFLQTWNKDADAPEFSITRLQMAVMSLFTMVFTVWYHCKNEITWESISLVLVLLIASFTPKTLKEIVQLYKKR